MTTHKLEARALGDSALTIRFGTERSPALLARIHASAAVVAAANIDAVEDIVPTYLSLTVFYDCLRRTYTELSADILAICGAGATTTDRASAAREHVIPTRYDGVDLSDVAAATGLSVEDVITRHSAREYCVDIIGFVPGFAYMSELNESLVIPRREQPRARVAPGSVAIAGAQTAVYPLATPGGWHIIGSTDAVMFDPNRLEPALLRAGDTVRFERIG
ncbi:MAG: 5-oxoprolinase subunit PxpB [Gemmatimonadota bacterium]|nr:5-oxoprolinase subunit PxpB [Gemmatimonadota bacterium]